MNRESILIGISVLLPLLLALYLCGKSVSIWETFEDERRAEQAYIALASEVEAGKYTNVEISDKFRSLAEAEGKVSKGAGLIKLSYYYWAVAFIAVFILQGFILTRMLGSHNKRL